MVIFTGETLETLFKAGGTQSWRLAPWKVKDCVYVVLCQNTRSTQRKQSWVISGNPRDQVMHGAAFLIGHISDVVASEKVPGRWLVKFDKFARIHLPRFWSGQQYPIRYLEVEEAPEISKLLADGVQFEPMPESGEESKHDEPRAARGWGEIIAETKRTLADDLGVLPEAIEIIIHS